MAALPRVHDNTGGQRPALPGEGSLHIVPHDRHPATPRQEAEESLEELDHPGLGRLQPAELVRGHLITAEVDVRAWEGLESGAEHPLDEGSAACEASGRGKAEHVRQHAPLGRGRVRRAVRRAAKVRVGGEQLADSREANTGSADLHGLAGPRFERRPRLTYSARVAGHVDLWHHAYAVHLAVRHEPRNVGGAEEATVSPAAAALHMVAVGTYRGQPRSARHVQPPALVVGQVEVQHVEFEAGQPPHEGLDSRHLEEVTRHVEVKAAPAIRRLVGNEDWR